MNILKRLKASMAFSKGVMLYDQGNKQVALEKFREAIRYNPSHVNALYNLGLILEKDFNKIEEAIENYQEAIKYKSDYPEAWNNWGLALARLEKYEEAIEKFKESIKHKGDYLDAHNNLATALQITSGLASKESVKFTRP